MVAHGPCELFVLNSTPHKAKNPTSRTRDWSEYNKTLINRGRLVLWFDEQAIASWHTAQRTGTRGAPRTYTDALIRCALVLQALYRIPLRATQGLLASVFELLSIDLPVPDYSTLSRRRKYLTVSIPEREANGILHLVVNSAGVSLFTEAEWHKHRRAPSKRRRWRKLQLPLPRK